MARGHGFAAATTTTTTTATTSHHHHSSSSSSAPNRGFLNVHLAANGYGKGFVGSSTQQQHFVRLGGGKSGTTSAPTGGTTIATQQCLVPTSAVSPLRLASPDESTRVQLQRQRLRGLHRTQAVKNKIPGFKTSAAFLSSLRTNLRLHASPPSSPMSTPPSMRGSASSLPPPSPLSGAIDPANDIPDAPAPEDPLAGVPELNSYLAQNDQEKSVALKLVADSIAQMRQAANQSLIFHPLNMALMIAVLSFVANYMYNARHDWSIVGTTCVGLIMCFLAVYRFFTQDYLYSAEAMNWDWLGDADVIVSKFGDEVIGTIIVDWVSGESRQKRKKAWRGEIKAWTVRLKYRRKGVGHALLEDAVKEARKKGAESIEFADDHANSKRVLPRMYNSKFDKRERTSRDLLTDLLEASPTRGKRKSR